MLVGGSLIGSGGIEQPSGILRLGRELKVAAINPDGAIDLIR